MAPGAVTVLQAVLLSGSFPVPVFAPGWPLSGPWSGPLAPPLPDHHLELLRPGADG